MLKQRIALLPIAMSAAAVGIDLVHLMWVGAAPQTDEGAEAHLWQLLMVGQIPIVVFFAVTGLARNPRRALGVLAGHGKTPTPAAVGSSGRVG
jgi:hypothetical protein